MCSPNTGGEARYFFHNSTKAVHKQWHLSCFVYCKEYWPSPLHNSTTTQYKYRIFTAAFLLSILVPIGFYSTTPLFLAPISSCFVCFILPWPTYLVVLPFFNPMNFNSSLFLFICYHPITYYVHIIVITLRLDNLTCYLLR